QMQRVSQMHKGTDGAGRGHIRWPGRSLWSFSTPAPPLLQSPDHPGPDYDRAPEFAEIAREVDVMVPMRDGVNICVDIYRPNAAGKFPTLLAFAIYNKDLQGPIWPTFCHRNPRGRRCGQGRWRRATPSSGCRAATYT